MRSTEFLTFHHTTDESLKDKDHMKQEAYDAYSKKMVMTWSIPIGFSLWQSSLINNAQKAY